MKKYLFLFATLLMTSASYAQTDVTKFLGIPVDGTKSAMIQKLKAKGFVYDSKDDCMTGEFNGSSVNLRIVTNNNKVWRIMVADKNWATEESDIRIRFNKLISQFRNNKKYREDSAEEISEDEDISYKMSVDNKRYEASFYQLPLITDSVGVERECHLYLLKEFSEEQIANPTPEESVEISSRRVSYAFRSLFSKSVWFMINRYAGRYWINLYYDNEYNHSDGEEL